MRPVSWSLLATTILCSSFVTSTAQAMQSDAPPSLSPSKKVAPAKPNVSFTVLAGGGVTRSNLSVTRQNGDNSTYKSVAAPTYRALTQAEYRSSAHMGIALGVGFTSLAATRDYGSFKGEKTHITTDLNYLTLEAGPVQRVAGWRFQEALFIDYGVSQSLEANTAGPAVTDSKLSSDLSGTTRFGLTLRALKPVYERLLVGVEAAPFYGNLQREDKTRSDQLSGVGGSVVLGYNF